MSNLPDMLRDPNAYRGACSDLCAGALRLTPAELADLTLAVAGQSPQRARQIVAEFLSKAAAREEAAPKPPASTLNPSETDGFPKAKPPAPAPPQPVAHVQHLPPAARLAGQTASPKIRGRPGVARLPAAASVSSAANRDLSPRARRLRLGHGFGRGGIRRPLAAVVQAIHRDGACQIAVAAAGRRRRGICLRLWLRQRNGQPGFGARKGRGRVLSPPTFDESLSAASG